MYSILDAVIIKVLNPPTNNILSCSSTSACNSNITPYSISTFNSYRNLNVIGIVKDEHHIYGSYDSNGTETTKGFDMCNGMFYDLIGNYIHFTTRTYSYIKEYFGPSNFSNVVLSYTTNP
ncbi:unnamed protein product [Adineta steineri]|uniref:Uncharacterized protein n=1 Tax=Adineta steineri TaxID=433720 RepID=A0A813MP04_9BILA|nr:unnamed protein product [Adineta steineri]CAF0754872.1 unnamed protein product [Adineta steineri]CAF3483815.1 unnamed protein product [Adineta steineri]CAF3900511.1 unnamed protein product [Adineta steineri]